MDAGVLAAIISVSGAVGLGIANSFVAERYKRFHDGSSLAAGLAGELASHAAAIPLLRVSFANMLAAVRAGAADKLTFRPFERPRDPFYEAGVGQLGLLGLELVEHVVFVYSNMGAMRSTLVTISAEGASMDADELERRILAAVATLEAAIKRGELLMPLLRARAREPFISTWALTGS